jgi:hypothetical protein
MRGYFTISDEEKNSILKNHSSFYNGYSVGNVPSNQQSLLQDEGPNDINGINVNNKGEVSTYKNHLVNESTEEVKEYSADDMDVSDVDASYDFESGGPEQFKDEIDSPPVYGDEEDDFETELEFDSKGGSDDYDFSYSDDSYSMDIDSIMNMFDGLHDYDNEYDGREDYEGEVPAYQFDSENDMDVDLYEEEQCEGCDSEMKEGSEMCEMCGGEMMEGECMECGNMYEEVDEDLRESLLKEKNRISEMFDRFKRFN